MELRHPYQASSDSGGEGSGPQKKKMDKGQSMVMVGIVDDDNSNYGKGALVEQQQEQYSSSYTLDLGVAASASSKPSSLAVSGSGSGAGGVTQGRCRRTDGKRWRCSRNAIPLEKYCEQHMHRGRNRSRKHVESLESKSPLVELLSAKLDCPFWPSNDSTSSKPRDTPTRNSPVAKLDNSLGVVNNTTPNCSDKNGDSCVATTVAIAASCPPIVASPSSTASADVIKTETNNGVSVSSNNADNKKDEKENNNTKSCVGMDNHIMIRCNDDKKLANTSTKVFHGIGISSESVLPASGCKDKDVMGMEPEMSRCRRTDGKKWRCKRDVLPQQKYCARHMHRGAKRRQEIPQAVKATVRCVVATPSNRLPFTTTTPVLTEAQVASPSTKLSMSISGRTQLIPEDDEKSGSSSDTDTTISDSMIDYIDVAS